MEVQVQRLIEQCSAGSDDGSLTFPEVVGKLMAAGIEGYRTDLQRAEKTYYLPNGESHVTPTQAVAAGIAHEFSAKGVADAVRAIQAQKISYKEFMERIAAAGCVDYRISLPGRRAVYCGRTGESYVELFPAAKS